MYSILFNVDSIMKFGYGEIKVVQSLSFDIFLVIVLVFKVVYEVVRGIVRNIGEGICNVEYKIRLYGNNKQ